jgi:hypothetical protein
MATSGSGFSFGLPAQAGGGVGEAAAGAVPGNAGGEVALIKVSLTNGSDLPSWVKFDPTSKLFTATSVPDGAFPLQIVVTTGGVSTTIVISEKTQK